jgi:NTE family protein
MPRMVRFMLDGLGRPDAQSADLMSYLLFDSAYTQALIDIGYHDASGRMDEIEAFLLGPRAKGSARGKRHGRRIAEVATLGAR